MFHFCGLEKWASLHHTPFTLLFHIYELYALTLNHQRSVLKNNTKIMVRSRELAAERRQVPEWKKKKNTLNTQKQYFTLLFQLFFFCGRTFPLIYSTRTIVSTTKLNKNNMSDYKTQTQFYELSS